MYDTSFGQQYTADACKLCNFWSYFCIKRKTTTASGLCLYLCVPNFFWLTSIGWDLEHTHTRKAPILSLTYWILYTGMKRTKCHNESTNNKGTHKEIEKRRESRHIHRNKNKKNKCEPKEKVISLNSTDGKKMRTLTFAHFKIGEMWNVQSAKGKRNR